MSKKKNLENPTKGVSSAETNKPDKPEVAQDSPIAVQGQPVQEGVSQDAPKDEFVGIADLIKDIPDSKIEMAEGLGIPIRPILRWAYVIEANVKAQGKALQQLGVNLQPVVELAQKVKAQQQNPAALASATGNSGNLGTIVSLVKEAMGPQAGGMSQGDIYFSEIGREVANMSVWMMKENFKRMMPDAYLQMQAAAAPK